jgi:hypothetical protein
MFGQDQGYLVGTITNDIMSISLQNMQQPSIAYVVQTAPSKWNSGETFPGSAWTNYTATGMLGQAAVNNQIWELGNSIAVIQGALPTQTSQPVENSADDDPGNTTLTCYQNATETSWNCCNKFE